jgi:hypothetical protein
VLVHYPALVLADEIETVLVCCRAAWRLRRFACQQPRLRYPPLSNDRPSCGLRQMPEAARIAVVGRALCTFSLVVTPSADDRSTPWLLGAAALDTSSRER